MELSNFIRRARTSRTSTQVQELIELELSNIRAELKRPKTEELAQLISKIVCAYLWGYNVSWEYVHICTLCSVAKTHSEKRIAYLALTLIYNEATQLFSLATNALAKDLVEDSISTHYKVSLALNAVCTVCTKETAPLFSSKVHSLISSGSSIYLRKKAIVATCALIKANPELSLFFVDVCAASLSDKAHSVVLAGCELGITLLEYNDKLIEKLYLKIYHLLKVLSKLCAVTNFPDHNVGGLCDPLLHHAILRFLSKAINAAYKYVYVEFQTILPSLKKYFVSVFTSILERVSSNTVSHSLGISICVQVFKLFADIPDLFFLENQCQSRDGVIPEENSLPGLIMCFLRPLLEAVTDYSDLISCSALEALHYFVLHKKQTIGLDSDSKFKRFSQLLKRPNPAVRKRVLDLLLLLVHKKDIRSYIADLFLHIEKEPHDRLNMLVFINSIKEIVLLSVLSPQEGFDCLFKLALLINTVRNNAISQAVLTIMSRKDVTPEDRRHFISAFAPHKAVMIDSAQEKQPTPLMDTYLIVISFLLQTQQISLQAQAYPPLYDDIVSEFSFAMRLSKYIFQMQDTNDVIMLKVSAVRALACFVPVNEQVKADVFKCYDSIIRGASHLLLISTLQYKAILSNPGLLHTLSTITYSLPKPPNVRSTKLYTNPALLTSSSFTTNVIELHNEEKRPVDITLSTISQHLELLTDVDRSTQSQEKQLTSTVAMQPAFVNDDIKVYVSKLSDNNNTGDSQLKLQISLYAVSNQLMAKLQYSIPKSYKLCIDDSTCNVTGPLKQPIVQIITLWSNSAKSDSHSNSTSHLSDSDVTEPLIQGNNQAKTDSSIIKEELTEALSVGSKKIILRIRATYIVAHSIKQSIDFTVGI